VVLILHTALDIVGDESCADDDAGRKFNTHNSGLGRGFLAVALHQHHNKSTNGTRLQRGKSDFSTLRCVSAAPNQEDSLLPVFLSRPFHDGRARVEMQHITRPSSYTCGSSVVDCFHAKRAPCPWQLTTQHKVVLG